jgi:hypothetical protein
MLKETADSAIIVLFFYVQVSWLADSLKNVIEKKHSPKDLTLVSNWVV